MSIYVTVLLEAQWGWSVRVPGASVGGASLPLPPPSTLVGALASPLARMLGWGETIVEKGVVYSSTLKLVRHLEAAGARIVDGVAAFFSDPLKAVNIPYLRPQNRLNENMWFSLQAMGAYSAPSVKLEATLVFKDTLLEEGVDEKTLEAAAWSISRIGCKEGLVHVSSVVVGRALRETGGLTPYYAPTQSLKNKAGTGEIIVVWDPRDPAAYGRLRRRTPREIALAIPRGAGRTGLIGVTTGVPRQALREDYPSYRVKTACKGEEKVACLPPV